VYEGISGEEQKLEEDLLTSLEDLMNIQKALEDTSEIAQRDLSSEFASIKQRISGYHSLLTSVFEGNFTVSKPIRGPQLQKTGLDLLNDIEAALSITPSSIKMLRENRSFIASALSKLNTAITPLLKTNSTE
jgi:hypothetical protein